MLFEAQELASEGLGPLDLQLTAGECLGLSGASGAGKTRLLRSLADLDPHQGTLRLQGVAAEQMSPASWRRQVGLLPSESRWWAATVAEHFPNPMQQPDLTQIGLDAAAWHWRVERLSSGERQRLALLRLLANRPQVLLLDEPTANLDARNTDRIEGLIAAYRRDHSAAVIWVSHDKAQLERVADRQQVITHGRLANATGVAA